MRKKKIALLLLFIILATAISIGLTIFKSVTKKIYNDVYVEEFAFEISYPKYYEDIPKAPATSVEKITENIITTVTETDKIAPELLPTLVKEVISTRSNRSGMYLNVEAIKKEKTPKTIEELCKDYAIMFSVFNENADVMTQEYAEVEIAGYKAGKVDIYVKTPEILEYPFLRQSYLIPLEDREITITFGADINVMEENKEEINKIVNSLKIFELENTGKNYNET